MLQVFQALDFATQKHRHQRRKNESKEPYINHPIRVATILTSCGILDESILMAALLHDVVEDQGVTETELKEKFGEKVASFVMGCSDDRKLSKAQRKIAQIEEAKKACDQVKLIKLADKFDNVQGLVEDPPSTWKEEEIQGCMLWSREVCKQCYGVNSTLDHKVQNLFLKCKLSDDETEIQKSLSHYYKTICMSK